MPWHHAPTHHLSFGDTFFITGGTYLKQPFYRDELTRDELQEILFAQAQSHDCWLQAWVLMANHYHLVVRADGNRVKAMLTELHKTAARALNAHDGIRGRRVWYQFWDKTLTFEGSWIARLRYTNENPVHHGIVGDARRYRWCLASVFEETAPRKLLEAVGRVKIDSVKVYDEF